MPMPKANNSDKISKKINKLTAKEELFCQEYVKNKQNVIAALDIAYPCKVANPSKHSREIYGYSILDRPQVIARIHKLQTTIINKAAISVTRSVEGILAKLDEVIKLGMETGKLNAVNQSLTLMAKILGYTNDNINVNVMNKTNNVIYDFTKFNIEERKEMLLKMSVIKTIQEPSIISLPTLSDNTIDGDITNEI